MGLVVPILQGQVVTVVQPSGTTAILTDTPETDAIGEEIKAKTKEVSTRQQTTPKSKKEKTQNIKKTRGIQRAQTSLAEADHYSNIAHCKNVEPWW